MPDAGETAGSPRPVRVGVLGAGISGICAAVFLREKLGLKDESIIGIERHPSVGGNCLETAYPGLACDTPATVYQLSFASNPNWSCLYPFQPELLKYFVSVAKKFDVERLFTFNRRTTKLEWLEDKAMWRISYVDLVPTDGPATKDSQIVAGSEGSVEVDFIFNTSGSTNEPGLPYIPGAIEGTFEGESWHSMRWPKDGLDRIKGKRVALVGCAAAAIQLVPQLAKVAGYLGVHHRTPNHVVERPNEPFSEEQKKRWTENPMEYRMYRAQFEQDFAEKWFQAGFQRESAGYKHYMESARRNLQVLKDEKLREIMWPEFDLWCRRVLFHNEFYPAINMPHVELIQERIVRIEKDGIVTADQNSRDKVIDPNAKEIKREYDIIVYATGWAVSGGKPGSMPILGQGGTPLPERMLNLDHKDPEIQAYMGVMLDKFPNYFVPGGATGIPLFSLVNAIETHVDYAVTIIKHCIGNNIRSIAPTHEAVLRWCKRVDDGARGTPIGTKANCSGFYAVPKPDGTETRRIYLNAMPSQVAFLMKYPVYKDFETVEESGQRWEVPVAPNPSRLDEAYQGVHIVE